MLVAKTYQVSDMSQTYPLMRGTAPLLVAIISVIFLGDHLSPLAWLGIGVICLAILAMAFNGRSRSSTGILLALINACFIAGYTLVDGTGVRLSETALGYTLWTFFMNGFCLLGWAMIARRPQASRYLRQHWKKGLVGGVGTMGSYGLALWAMTRRRWRWSPPCAKPQFFWRGYRVYPVERKDGSITHRGCLRHCRRGDSAAAVVNHTWQH